jgi:circadian clock protein KaiB
MGTKRHADLAATDGNSRCGNNGHHTTIREVGIAALHSRTEPALACSTRQRSLAALANLKRLCDEYLAGRFHIEVIDLLKNPRLAKDDQIVAIPTLLRKLPEPLRRIVGDFSDSERTLVGLQLRPRS